MAGTSVCPAFRGLHETNRRPVCPAALSQGKRPLAAAQEMLDDVAADKPGATYDQACRLLGLGFRVHLAHSSPGAILNRSIPAFIEDRCGRAQSLCKP